MSSMNKLHSGGKEDEAIHFESSVEKFRQAMDSIAADGCDGEHCKTPSHVIARGLRLRQTVLDDLVKAGKTLMRAEHKRLISLDGEEKFTDAAIEFQAALKSAEMFTS